MSVIDKKWKQLYQTQILASAYCFCYSNFMSWVRNKNPYIMPHQHQLNSHNYRWLHSTGNTLNHVSPSCKKAMFDSNPILQPDKEGSSSKNSALDVFPCQCWYGSQNGRPPASWIPMASLNGQVKFREWSLFCGGKVSQQRSASQSCHPCQLACQSSVQVKNGLKPSQNPHASLEHPQQ